MRLPGTWNPLGNNKLYVPPDAEKVARARANRAQKEAIHTARAQERADIVAKRDEINKDLRRILRRKNPIDLLASYYLKGVGRTVMKSTGGNAVPNVGGSKPASVKPNGPNKTSPMSWLPAGITPEQWLELLKWSSQVIPGREDPQPKDRSKKDNDPAKSKSGKASREGSIQQEGADKSPGEQSKPPSKKASSENWGGPPLGEFPAAPTAFESEPEFTKEETAKLLEAKNTGKSWKDIAEELGKDSEALQKYWKTKAKPEGWKQPKQGKQGKQGKSKESAKEKQEEKKMGEKKVKGSEKAEGKTDTSDVAEKKRRDRAEKKKQADAETKQKDEKKQRKKAEVEQKKEAEAEQKKKTEAAQKKSSEKERKQKHNRRQEHKSRYKSQTYSAQSKPSREQRKSKRSGKSSHNTCSDDDIDSSYGRSGIYNGHKNDHRRSNEHNKRGHTREKSSLKDLYGGDDSSKNMSGARKYKGHRRECRFIDDGHSDERYRWADRDWAKNRYRDSSTDCNFEGHSCRYSEDEEEKVFDDVVIDEMERLWIRAAAKVSKQAGRYVSPYEIKSRFS